MSYTYAIIYVAWLFTGSKEAREAVLQYTINTNGLIFAGSTVESNLFLGKASKQWI